jgi:cell division protein FtsZ
MKMKEIQEAASLIQEQAHEDANIIFGASIDENMADTLKVTVIATGFQHASEEMPVEVARRATVVRPETRESVAPSVARSQVPARIEAPVPAYSTRRPQAPSIATTAGGAREAQMSLPVRERITFPSSSNMESDWDVPAFQRRAGG